tara:strand:+ start:1296 stop:2111 length:816 start_codon:yes stop_codon:yes gene_type:complete
MKKLIIAILILIILFSLYLQHNRGIEGYTNYMNPDPEMVKKITYIDDSIRKQVLGEIYENVRKHEEIFKTYDNEYLYENIQQKENRSNLQNIYALFPILKKQDNELIKLTKHGNKYTRATTLDDLIDGTLTQTYINDLENLRDYKPPSLMPQKVIDPYVMREIATEYREKAASINNKDLKDKLIRKANSWEEKSYKKEIEGEPADNANVPIDDQPIITQESIDSKVEMLIMYYIVNIIKYQDQSIGEIFKLSEQTIFSIYPNLTQNLPNVK